MKLTINDIDIRGKRCLVRVDFNVPQDETGAITDDNRIAATVPTVQNLLARGAKVILMSHLGRPKGAPNLKYTLAPAAKRLSELLGKPVKLAADAVGADAARLAATMRSGEIIMLENLRFYAEEEANEPEFCKKLAAFADIYVNDAFGTAHRAHASTAGIAAFVSVCVCGLLVEKELAVMGKALQNPARPFVAILGGSKVSDKIGVINNLLGKVDALLIGGGMAYTFAKAKGGKIGTSICENDKIPLALELLAKAEKSGVKMLLPVDNVVAAAFSNDAERRIVKSGEIPDNFMGMDIGPETVKIFAGVIKTAKTIVWNGPVGVFEMPNFAVGTFAVAKAVAESGAVSIIGGGDLAAAVAEGGYADKITHISTGGGASLEFLEGKKLPGIECLGDKQPLLAIRRKCMREKIIAGNWKMNMLVRDAVGFVSELAEKIGTPDKTVVICAGATCLMPMAHAALKTPINVGAQNMHWAVSGAFTGELSAAQILETGAKYAVIGHSERRQYFGETDKTVQMRTLAALNSDIRPIVCVGETRAERESGTTENVLRAQLTGALTDLPADKLNSLILAYEPVWAIGTGLVATPEQAQETIAFIRKTAAGLLGAAFAQSLPILYGGSMNEVNAHALLAMPDIDGGLIGGASLDASKLAKIILTKI